MDFSPFLGRLQTQVTVRKHWWSELLIFLFFYFLQCGTFIVWYDLITMQIKLLVMLHCWLQPFLPPPWLAWALQPHSVNIQRCTIDHSVVSAVGFNDLPDNVLAIHQVYFLSCSVCPHQLQAAFIMYYIHNCYFMCHFLCSLTVFIVAGCLLSLFSVFLSLTLCPIVLPSFCREGSMGCFTNRGDLWCEKIGTLTSSNPAALPVSPDVH